MRREHGAAVVAVLQKGQWRGAEGSASEDARGDGRLMRPRPAVIDRRGRRPWERSTVLPNGTTIGTPLLPPPPLPAGGPAPSAPRHHRRADAASRKRCGLSTKEEEDVEHDGAAACYKHAAAVAKWSMRRRMGGPLVTGIRHRRDDVGGGGW